MKNLYFFLVLMMGSLMIVSCGNDEEDKHKSNIEYKVDIDIVKPAENATVILILDSLLELEITFTHQTEGERIHNVLIDIVDTDDNPVATIFEEHVHSDLPYTYTNTITQMPDTAGIYKLRAMTTDFEGQNENMMTRELTVK